MIISFRKKSALWKSIIVFSWLPALAYTIGTLDLVTVGIYLTIFTTTIKFFTEILEYHKFNRNCLYILFLFLLYGIYSLLKIRSLSESGSRDLLYLGLIFMFFYMIFQYDFSENGTHILYICPVILSILMFILSFDKSLYVIYTMGSYSLYLNYQNPNILSYVLLVMLIYLSLGYIEEKKRIYVLCIIFTIYLLYLAKSRSSFIASLFFIFSVTLKKKYNPISSIKSIIYVLIPVFFVVIAVVLGNIQMHILGKSGIAGRNFIWEKILYFATIDPSFLLMGKSSETPAYMYQALRNSHNAYLQLLSNYGIFVTFLFISYLTTLTIKCGKYIRDKYTFAAYIGAIAILINCSFETHIVDAIIGMTFMWICLYKLILERRRLLSYDNNATTA